MTVVLDFPIASTKKVVIHGVITCMADCPHVTLLLTAKPSATLSTESFLAWNKAVAHVAVEQSPV